MKWILALLLMTITSPLFAASQMVCSTHEDVVEQLSRKYQEAPVWAGLTSDGSLLERYASADDHTWTFIISKPNGPTCLLAAGEDGQDMTDKETKPDGKGDGI